MSENIGKPLKIPLQTRNVFHHSSYIISILSEAKWSQINLREFQENEPLNGENHHHRHQQQQQQKHLKLMMITIKGSKVLGSSRKLNPEMAKIIIIITITIFINNNKTAKKTPLSVENDLYQKWSKVLGIFRKDDPEMKNIITVHDNNNNISSSSNNKAHFLM